MNRLATLILVLGVSLVVVASGFAAEANPDQAKVVAEIERLGGNVTVDGKSPGKPVIGVVSTDDRGDRRWVEMSQGVESTPIAEPEQKQGGHSTFSMNLGGPFR